jgi:hypothetical protein
MSTWLTPEEIIELTARKRWTTQCLALAQMGIPFRPNFAGRPLVERAAVLRYDNKPTHAPSKPNEPNWDLVVRGNARNKR